MKFWFILLVFSLGILGGKGFKLEHRDDVINAKLESDNRLHCDPISKLACKSVGIETNIAVSILALFILCSHFICILQPRPHHNPIH